MFLWGFEDSKFFDLPYLQVPVLKRWMPAM
jgi:hypothetical protein